MFQISPLQKSDFDALLRMDDEALAQRGARWYIADSKPGFPCRVSLEDAEPGERVLLLPYEHQNGASPYRASGPIFVRASAATRRLMPAEVPAMLRARLLSLRAYDAEHLMIDADVCDGRALDRNLRLLLERPEVAYVHVHFAKPGCYACRVDRVPPRARA